MKKSRISKNGQEGKGGMCADRTMMFLLIYFRASWFFSKLCSITQVIGHRGRISQ